MAVPPTGKPVGFPARNFMTIEEAITQLRYCIELINDDDYDWLDERDIPVLELAIEALEEKLQNDKRYCNGTDETAVSSGMV